MDLGVLGLIYCGIRAGTVAPGVSGSDITLSVLIWRTGPWFFVAVAWNHDMWVLLVDVVVLGLILVWVRLWWHGGH